MQPDQLACPHCETVFLRPAVMPAHGVVRCGRCGNLFGAGEADSARRIPSESSRDDPWAPPATAPVDVQSTPAVGENGGGGGSSLVQVETDEQAAELARREVAEPAFRPGGFSSPFQPVDGDPEWYPLVAPEPPPAGFPEAFDGSPFQMETACSDAAEKLLPTAREAKEPPENLGRAPLQQVETRFELRQPQPDEPGERRKTRAPYRAPGVADLFEGQISRASTDRLPGVSPSPDKQPSVERDGKPAETINPAPANAQTGGLDDSSRTLESAVPIPMPARHNRRWTGTLLVIGFLAAGLLLVTRLHHGWTSLPVLGRVGGWMEQPFLWGASYTLWGVALLAAGLLASLWMAWVRQRRARGEPVDIAERIAAQARLARWTRRGEGVLVVTLSALALWQVYDRFYQQWLQHPAVYRLAYQACHYLGCTLEPLTDVRLMRLQSARVISPPGKSGILEVDATLLNDAVFSQPYPQIRLAFRAMDRSLIASRIFQPEEYLRGAVVDNTRMVPGVPVSLHLELVDPGSDAVHYEFELLSAAEK